MQQRAQAGQMEIQQQQLAQQDQEAFRTAMSDPAMQGKTTGEIADALASQGHISLGAWQSAKKADIDQRKALQEVSSKDLENMKAAHAMTQDLYNNVMNMPDDQLAANWATIAQQYDAIPGNQKMQLNPQQPMTKQQLSQFGPLISMGNAYFDQELARREKQIGLKTAETNLTQKEAESQFYQQNGGAPGVSAELMQQSDWMKKNPGKGPSDYKKWVMQNSPAAMVMGNQLSPEAVALAAQNLLTTGQAPQGLYRSPGSVSAVYDQAAKMNAAQGGAGIAMNKATFEADKKSLDALQKSFDTVTAFENTANKNIDMLKGIAQKVPDLGARFANVPIRMLSDKMIGSENMAAFKTALAPVQAESAKILNSANLSGQLTDSARKELQDIIDGNMPYRSLVASLNVLQKDFKNRHDSMQQQIGDIKGRLAGKKQSGTLGPTVGTVENGYRFKGGDPAKQENWEQVK